METATTWREVAWEACSDAYFLIDPTNRHIVDMNRAAEILMDAPRSEIIGRLSTEFMEEFAFSNAVEVSTEGGRVATMMSNAVFLDGRGQRRHVNVMAWTLRGADGETRRLARIEAIHELGSQSDLQRLNWALAAYARSSAALRQQRNFEDLARRVCEAVVDNDVYRLAWVGLADDGPGKPVPVIAGSGPAAGYLDGLRVSWSEEIPEGRGPTGMAIRSGMPHVMRDSTTDAAYGHWRVRGLSFGIRSSVTVPIKVGGGVAGALLVYASQPDAFGQNELSVFAQLADDLAFALTLQKDRDLLEASERARSAAEQSAREAQAELARVARVSSLGELVASISHEINQPLAGVVTNSGAALRWLVMKPPNLDEARHAMTRLVRDANRGSDVIRRIRSFVSKEAPQFAEFDLAEALQEVRVFVRAEKERANVQLQLNIDPQLPAVFGDRVQIQQVLLNLIVNAVEAMAEVTDRPRILSVGAEALGSGEVVVQVADNGVGFSPESADRLFEHLFTTKTGGMGLGLSISRSIVEAHGGHLSARQNSPFGAVFEFTLPRTET